ncbi:esterase/lipase family protein [Paucibacter sp. Y2R2-4]|uniref:esterase/lipase family protein n=1 Tax=Paucibacter sp. Y2R2-4 TaxID=2893553 RepID=UPI0021E40342|nr:GPI inositol-deacylase [Paucibacter sp. Y2R2-4]MCV2349241.1 GPI inositol-deacylase [Paucibacter sp. Y2R2-4]
MIAPPPKKRTRHLRPSDLRGIAQLATQATAGVSRMVEGVHQSIWDRFGLPGGPQPGQARGLTGLAYRSVRGVNHWVGRGLDITLSGVESLFKPEPGAAIDEETPQRAAWLAALNGVMGDHLRASHNPLATEMSLRWQGQALDWHQPPQDLPAQNKVLLWVHGLCMNELQWAGPHPGQAVAPGTTLAKALGYCPLYLRYNSGLHTSQNGRELAQQLQTLKDNWPVPLEEISIIAHSMGGLLARSACQIATEQGLNWLEQLKNVVFLGTPHHGAPLERAGNWIDVLLGSTPFTAPLAKLGQLRSAGITDLRHGYVRDEDWSGSDRFQRKADSRVITPLPEGVNCFAIAATLASKRASLANQLIGDGLVPLHSALGEHSDPRRTLAFAPSAQRVFYGMNHMALLKDPQVTRQIKAWLQSDSSPSQAPI